jgi:hypothetical protein
MCYATTFLCNRVSGGPKVYVVKDHTNLGVPRRQVKVLLRQCYNFIKEYRLPCRHVLKIARVEGWLSTLANRDSFFAYWCAEEYWVTNYIEGYSAPQIQLPVENSGKFTPDADYLEEVGEIELQPPGDRKVPKVGRRRNKRHKSKGEEGSARKSGRKKKVPDGGSDSNEEGTEERTLDALL